MRLRQQRRRRSPTIRPSTPVATTTPAAYRARRGLAERDTAPPSVPEPVRRTAQRWGRFWLQRIGLLILAIAVVASVVNILSLSGQVTIVNLQAKSQLARPSNVYAQAAGQALASSVWNRNKITVDAAAVSRQLMAQFPELNQASLTIPLLAHRPVVYLTPAQPTLILAASNGAFLVGDTGKAILSAATPAALNQPSLPVVTDQTGFQAKANRQALPATSVRFIHIVTAQLAAKQIAIAGFSLTAGGSELDAHLAGQPYLVKFNLQAGDPTGEAGTFLATANYLHQHNFVPSSYVDVRVDGRAYFK